MSGRLDTSHAEPPRHRCDLPPHLKWADEPVSEDWPGRLEVLTPVGSRFFCDICPKVWICVWVPDQVSPRSVVCAHHDWREETRKERRQRLGLKWWQRDAISR